jgi:hypothetical protein
MVPVTETVFRENSLIWTNWEGTIGQRSEGPNYRIATENMFREVIKWTSPICLGNTSLFLNLDCMS